MSQDCVPSSREPPRGRPVGLRALRVVLGSAALVSAACAAPPRSDYRASLLAADSAAGTDLAGAFAEDAYLLAPGLPAIAGRRAIAEHLDTASSREMERRPLLAATSADGGHGYSIGRVLVRPGDGEEPTHGKYLAYWEREPGAGWRILAYVANQSPPAPDSVPPAPAAGVAAGPASPDDLLEADAEFSARSEAAGAGAAFAAWADSGAVALLDRGHSMLWGPAAIGEYFARVIPTTARLTWTPTAARVAPGGDLGFTVGEATYREEAEGSEPRLFYTKYLTVWRRQPSGEWRYAADGGNQRPAPQTATPRVLPGGDRDGSRQSASPGHARTGPRERRPGRRLAAFVAAQGLPAGWGGFLASDGATRTVVGTCAFKGPPDETGAMEIAYFTFPSHEGRGYGSAMAEALVERAGSNPEVSVVRAHTLPERNSSGRILQKLGFAFVGIVQLPEDGAVWRWERPVSPGA